MHCASIRGLIMLALSAPEEGPNLSANLPGVLGGPDWLDSDRYEIVATAPADAPTYQLTGVMMWALLEDRFKLSAHRETREVPVYALSVAKGGHKMSPLKEGSCILPGATPVQRPQQGQPPPVYCGSGTRKANGSDIKYDAHGMTMTEFAGRFFGGNVDLPVIDRTGLTGRFDFHLEYLPEKMLAARGLSEIDSDLSVFTAVRVQLGLQLIRDKGPAEVIVIDHVERPTEN